MRNSSKTLPVLALLAWAAPLAAQDTTQPAPEAPAPEAPASEAPAAEVPATNAPAAEAPAAEAPPAETTPEADAPATEGTPDLSLGEPAEGEAQVGQPYVREEFGDWSLRCLRTEDGNDPCQLYQLLLDGEGNAVAEISMFPLPSGQEAVAGAEIVAPLMTLLTEDITMSVDGTGGRRYPFSFCNAAGCVARVGFTAEEVAQFKAGNAGLLSLIPAMAPDQRVDLAISLSGFTAGYDAVVAAAEARAAAGGE